MTTQSDQPACFAVWTTAWGPIGGVLRGGLLHRVILPHYQAKELADVLAWEHPGSVRDDAPFQRLIELTREYFNGRPVDFAEIACEVPSEKALAGKVLRACRQIPYGQTSTYGELAKQIGQPEAARAVAAALGRNGIPLVIPCHRVTYSDGRLGGFSAPGGVEVKRRMLDLEKAAPAPR